jgi:DNA invertase Pin-like site-specific DNA recombinase
MVRKIINFYVRQSLNDGSDSLRLQKNRLLKGSRNYCKKHRINYKKAKKNVFSEIRSAYKLRNNKTLVGLGEKLKRGDYIFILRVDRLSRDTRTHKLLNEWKRKGINVVSIGENINYKKDGNQFIKLLAKAQASSCRKSLKRRMILQKLRRNGSVIGTVARYGYKFCKIDGIQTQIVNEEEQGVIKKLNEYQSSGLKYEEIAEKLNKNKMLYRGKKWNDKNVYYVINKNKRKEYFFNN